MKPRKPQSVPRKPAPEFPALRDFFSGYLHQDFRDEYDSPAAAAAAFCSEASQDEIAAVRSEWTTWRKQLGDAPPEEAAAAIRKLGGTWAPESEADFKGVEVVLDVG